MVFVLATLWFLNAFCAADGGDFWSVTVGEGFFAKVRRYVAPTHNSVCAEEDADDQPEEECGDEVDDALVVTCLAWNSPNRATIFVEKYSGGKVCFFSQAMSGSAMFATTQMTYTECDGRERGAIVSALLPDSLQPKGTVTVTPPHFDPGAEIPVSVVQPSFRPRNVCTCLCSNTDLDLKHFFFRSGDDQGVCVQTKVYFSDISCVDVSVGCANYSRGAEVVNPQYSRTFDFLRR